MPSFEGRLLISHGLQAAVVSADIKSVATICTFVKKEMILVHISPSNVKELIMKEQYTIIMLLLHNRIQVNLPTAKLKRSRTFKKVLTRMWENASVQGSSLSNVPECIEKYLKASDFIKALIEARKLKKISMNQLKAIIVRFMIDIQSFLDFEEIFSVCFKYKLVDTLFEFAESLELTQDNREKFAVEFFRYTLSNDMLDMTILVLDHYESALL